MISDARAGDMGVPDHATAGPDRARRYVMIGAPVTSVRTPPLLVAYLAEAGVESTVPTHHLEPDGLAAFMTTLRADPATDGLMVTMPHKRAILPHLDALTGVAARTGSVNAVKRVGTRLCGAQFDGIALRNAVLARGADLRSARVWLKGLGGAGLAIAEALLAHGTGKLMVSELDAAILARAAPLIKGAEIVAADAAAQADILVNATPMGMGADDPSPFDAATVSSARVVADIVADPNATRLAALTEAAGVTLVTGRQMVTHQIAPIGRWLLTDTLEQDA